MRNNNAQAWWLGLLCLVGLRGNKAPRARLPALIFGTKSLDSSEIRWMDAYLAGVVGQMILGIILASFALSGRLLQSRVILIRSYSRFASSDSALFLPVLRRWFVVLLESPVL